MIHDVVHCHVCPLKECCRVAAADASWRVQHDRDVESDFSALQKASLQCPLKRLVQEK